MALGTPTIYFASEICLTTNKYATRPSDQLERIQTWYIDIKGKPKEQVVLEFRARYAKQKLELDAYFTERGAPRY